MAVDRLTFYQRLAQSSDKRILLVVLDGLGGLPREPGGPTELEEASTPVMDRLAREGENGLMTPVLPGVAPGSGPAHLALFGYDPIAHPVGRGVLAALGVGIDLRPGDVAARINLCTLDRQGQILDRRAGRISSEEAVPLIRRLAEVDVGLETIVRLVKEYRACVVFRGSELDGRIADTDPQRIGVPPLTPVPLVAEATDMANQVACFIEGAQEALADHEDANGVLLRGFDSYAPLPSFGELYRLRAAAVATYPMYRGVARLAGMVPIEVGDTLEELADGVRSCGEYDFVYLHYKYTDSRGEDGDFGAKVREIERADELIGMVLDCGFDVITVTGDHSTPSRLRMHSWHPVPVLLWSDCCRQDGAKDFSEKACGIGSLGPIGSIDLLPLALAHAGRLGKFGA